MPDPVWLCLQLHADPAGDEMKVKVDKIKWKLTGRKEAQDCAVMPWEDRMAIHQQGIEEGWKLHRKHMERRNVEMARHSAANRGTVK